MTQTTGQVIVPGTSGDPAHIHSAASANVAAAVASLLVALLRLRSWARARVRSLLARAQCRVCLAVSSWRKGDG